MRQERWPWRAVARPMRAQRSRPQDWLRGRAGHQDLETELLMHLGEAQMAARRPQAAIDTYGEALGLTGMPETRPGS